MSKNVVDPKSKLNSNRWVIYEDPDAIMLTEGPDCGPITCLEGLKYTFLGFDSQVNSQVQLKDVEQEYYHPMILHILGQMLTYGINHNFFDYSLMGVDTKEDVSAGDIFTTRMQSIARDFDCGWGNHPFKELCREEVCPFCQEEIWNIGTHHAKFTCYVSCSCTKRMHLDCFVKSIFSWDQMSSTHSPYRVQSYLRDNFLGRILKCPSCNQINEPGLLIVHHCDGSLISIQPLPCYSNDAYNESDNSDPKLIPVQERIDFVPKRRHWLRSQIFPILWEEAKFLTYFKEDFKSYASLRTDGAHITSDNILLITDLSDSQEPSVSGLNTGIDDVNDKESTEPSTNNDESNVNPSKGDDGPQKEKDKNIPSQDPSGSDTESDTTSKQTGNKETSNKPTGNKETNINLVAPLGTGKKRRRQRTRPRGGHVLTIQDDADAKVVWDVYDNVPPDYCKKDDVHKNLQKYWTKEQADKEGTALFWSDKENCRKMKSIRENLVEAREKKEKQRITVLLREEGALLKQLDAEKNIQRYDQVIRLKYTTSKSSRVRNPKGKGVIQVRTPACWYGMILNGHVTTPLKTSWVNDMFPKPVVDYI